ncbi:MAG: glycosyltransferase [Planctomycetes bacterium]|nr:glycosyltransferase [Planctomycetota bacterium]
MRMVHAVHGFFPEFRGGTERYVEALALAQSAAGHSVRLLAGSGRAGAAPWIDLVRHRGQVLYRLHRIGIDIDFWWKSDAPHAEPLLRALLARLRPDVLHVHHWLRFSRTLVRLAAAEGIAVVLTLHDLASTCPRGFRVHAAGHFCRTPMSPGLCLGCAPAYPWQDPAEIRLEIARFRAGMRAELRAATRILVPGRAHADLLARLHGCSADRFTVVPLGAIPSVRPPGPRRPDPEGRLRLVHWGHFRPDKGVHVLLDALGFLSGAQRRQVHLTLHGEHVFRDYEATLRAKAEGLPVTFAGPYRPEDLDGARYDLAVIPSLCHESHSFVLDEAFGLGLPVLVSARGALLERCGDAGLSFAPGDPQALAARIRAVLADRARLEVLAAAIPAPPPAMAAHAAQVVGVYREAIAAGPPPGVVAPAVTAERLARARAAETRDIHIAELRWAVEDRARRQKT